MFTSHHVGSTSQYEKAPRWLVIGLEAQVRWCWTWESAQAVMDRGLSRTHYLDISSTVVVS
jgi:hypothetical protein